MARPVVLSFATDAHMRTISESRIIEHFVFNGWTRDERSRDGEGPRRIVSDGLVRWREAGVPVAHDANGLRCYDLSEVSLGMRIAGWKGDDPYWRTHHLPSVRALVLSFHPPGTPRDFAPRPMALPPRRITVTMQRRFNPAYLAPQGRLRLPLPHADATLRDLQVALDPPIGTPAALRVHDGYAELRLPAAPVEDVVLGARFDFIATPYAPSGRVGPLDAEERELYLRHSEDLLQVTPAIVALARELASGASTPLERLRRFYAHVTGRLDGAPFPFALLARPEPAGMPPQAGWYDCRIVSALFAALCRAADIPARRVTGYLVYPEAVGYHHWVEAWLDDLGWMPFDQWSGELSAVGQDAGWRDAFVGAVDYRMKTGILPRAFNGSPGVRLPAQWRTLNRDAGGATEAAIVDAATGDVVWTDIIRIALGDTLPPA